MPFAFLSPFRQAAFAQTESGSESSIESSSSNPLSQTVWQLEMIQFSNDERITIDQPTQYTLEFTETDRIYIRADCNRGFGTYQQDGSQLAVQLGGLTRAACPPGSRSNEYLQALQSAASYVLEDGKLYVNMRLDTGNLVFAPLTTIGREEVCTIVTTMPQAEETDALLELLNTDRAGIVADLEELSNLMSRLDAEGYGWATVLGNEGVVSEVQLRAWLIGALRMACE